MLNLIKDEISGIRKELIDDISVFVIEKTQDTPLYIESFDELNNVKIIIN